MPITLKHLKFNVTQSKFDEEKKKQGNSLNAQTTKTVKATYEQNVLNAKSMQFDTARKWIGRDDLTDIQIGERDAALVKDLTGELTKESVAFYGRGAGVKKMNYLDTLTMTEEEAETIDRNEKRRLDCDKTHRTFIRNKLRMILEACYSIDNDRIEFDGRTALEIVNHLKRLKTTNKTGLVHLEARSKYTEEAARRKVAEIFKAIGMTVKGCRIDGELISRVGNVDKVNAFMLHKLKKPLTIREGVEGLTDVA